MIGFLLAYCLVAGEAVAEKRIDSRTLAHYILAGVYERQGDLEKAIEEYKAALKIDSDCAQLRFSLAAALIKQNQIDEATTELERVLKLASSAQGVYAESLIIEAHTILALAYSLQGQIDKATREYEQALRRVLAVDPQNIKIHKSLGQLYLQQGKLSEAEKTFEFITSLVPADAQARFYLGTVYEEQKRRAEAIEEFAVAVRIDPDYPDALNSLGYLYAEESINLQEAEALIKKALEYDPDNGAYLDSLGWVYFKQGRYEQAVKELERAVEFLPHAVIYDHLGDAYFSQGNIAKAKESWQKSIELNSQDTLRVKEKLEEAFSLTGEGS